MRGRESGTSLVTLTIFAMVAMLLPASAIAAVSGQITRSEATQNWVSASIAGSATQTVGCVEDPEEPGSPPPPSGACDWVAYATVGPGDSIADCSSPGRRLESIGPGVQLVWEGEELKGVGTASFDLANVALAYGSAAPLLCLSVVEAVRETVQCPEGEEECPPYGIGYRNRDVDAALLVAPPPTGESPPPGGLDTLALPPPRSCHHPAKHKGRHRQRGGNARVSSLVRVPGKNSRRRGCHRRVSAAAG
jgi:hypothetical protein